MLDAIKNLNKSSVIIVAVVLLIIFIVESFFKKVYENQLKLFLENEKFAAFDARSNNFVTIMVMPAYKLEYYRLTSYLMREDREKIDISFSKLIKFAGKKNKIKILKQAFNYYINVDSQKCQEVLQQIQNSKDQQSAKECTILYDIVVNKKSDYIDEMLQEHQTANQQRKAVLEYLLYLQYTNKNDKKNASKYEALSHKNFESLSQ